MRLGVCDKSNSGGEAMTLLFLKTGERERESLCERDRERPGDGVYVCVRKREFRGIINNKKNI